MVLLSIAGTWDRGGGGGGHFRSAKPEDKNEHVRASLASCLLGDGTDKGDTSSSPPSSLAISGRQESWPRVTRVAKLAMSLTGYNSQENRP